MKIDRTNAVDGRSKYLWKLDSSKTMEIDTTLQIITSFGNSTSIRNAMAVPENLPALLGGDMKHGNSDGSSTVSDKTDNFEHEYASDDESDE